MCATNQIKHDTWNKHDASKRVHSQTPPRRCSDSVILRREDREAKIGKNRRSEVLPHFEKKDEVLPHSEKKDAVLPHSEKKDEVLPHSEKKDAVLPHFEKKDAQKFTGR